MPPWPPLPASPPPRLLSSERGSGSLHLAQRFSNLISSRRAKGWRPRPDPPGNGVCVKRFLWGGGGGGVLVHQPSPPWLHRGQPTGPRAPPVASLSCPQVNRHLGEDGGVGWGRGWGVGGGLLQVPGSGGEAGAAVWQTQTCTNTCTPARATQTRSRPKPQWWRKTSKMRLAIWRLKTEKLRGQS